MMDVHSWMDGPQSGGQPLGRGVVFLPRFTFWQSKRHPEPTFREQSPHRLVVQEDVLEVLVVLVRCREQTWAGIAFASLPGSVGPAALRHGPPRQGSRGLNFPWPPVALQALWWRPPPCASCCVPLTCPQKQLLLQGLLSQGRRQTAAAQERGDTGRLRADMPGPLLARQPHGVLPEPSLTALALQLCVELVHCGQVKRDEEGAEQGLRTLGASRLRACILSLA